ncbi:uncharacterized protein [Nicotiana sylvestris]|uniref:uncharacterized protein n=1 Tax=Nicotiana sylvestris TaxID=4096 RepID=UPI00388C8933
MDAMEIFRQRLGKVEGTLNVLEGHTLEEIESIRNDLEGRTQTEMELRQTITALECRLMEALSTIDVMKAKIESLEEHVNAGMTEVANNVVVTREAKIEAPKPPVFKGVRDAQEVENFFWHLENYFRHGKLRDDEAKINTTVLYLSETVMLWWRRKMANVDKGLGGGDRGKGKEIQQQYSKTQDFKKSSGRQGYAEKKAQVEKKGCNICRGPHSFRNYLDLKSFSAMVRERKEQPQGESPGTAQLGMIGLYGAVTKQAIQPTKNGNQYVDLTINNKPARAMVDTGATHNFVTEAAAKRLELKLAPTNSRIKTVNAEIQNARGVANGVGVKLGTWKGMTNFTVTAMYIFDIILGQEFFRHCHTLIDPYLQRLLVMEREGACMVPTETMPHRQIQAQLSAMQVVKGIKKGEPTFVATIASLEEDKNFQETVPPCIEKLLEENKDVMPEELPKHLPPRREFVVVYLDDIVIYNNTLEEHMKHLRKVFQVLRENELYIKREKCEFAQSKVHFLGHVVSNGELHMDDAKVRAIQEWEAPIKAFEGLKIAVTEDPVLALPDFVKTFEVHTDASDFAIGGVLMQDKHPFAFESRKLNETE